jgi:hypothetical protein
MDLSKFRTNVASAETGVEIDMGEGLFVRVAREGNAENTKALRRITKPYLHSYRTQTI